jgi:hypothetical protein
MAGKFKTIEEEIKFYGMPEKEWEALEDAEYADVEKHPDYHYEKKYGISIYADHAISQCALAKQVGKKTLIMFVNISNWEIRQMMLNSLKMGTNYLEDSLLAMGLKWEQYSKRKMDAFDP